jgi:FKBP-type peptidyl-prolyl cis-trans isomerase 2
MKIKLGDRVKITSSKSYYRDYIGIIKTIVGKNAFVEFTHLPNGKRLRKKIEVYLSLWSVEKVENQ